MVTKAKSKGFFDGNAKMLFVFGLVCGIALTMVIGSGLERFDSADGNGGEVVVVDDTQEQPVDELEDEPAVLAQITDADHVRGDLDKAKVVIVEYSDIECPYCGSHHETLVELMETYGDDIAWVYRHFPLSFHENAVPAALAAECAGDQGMFWDFTDIMYENQTALTDELFLDTATELGLDIADFTECYESGEYAQAIQDDMNSGVAAGVEGTPGNFVNGVMVSGAQPISVFESIIDQILAE